METNTTPNLENLNKQPNSNYCFICGRDNPKGLHLTFYDNGVDEVTSYVTVPNEYQSYPGIVHGGITTSILDEVVGRVAMIGDHHHFMVSVKLEVKFRKPVPLETPLKVVGTIVKIKGRLGQAVGKVYLPDDSVAAEASMTIADVPKEILESASWEELGWRVDD